MELNNAMIIEVLLTKTRVGWRHDIWRNDTQHNDSQHNYK
jgi:hypothetical protein